jgi:hypothetical protein
MARRYGTATATATSQIIPTAAFEWITVEKAKVLLDRNVLNRRYRPKTAAKYARDLVADKWITTHEGIGIDVDGNVFDGQHRLNAIILADKPMFLLVVRNLPREARLAVDQGIQRTIDDVLNNNGIPVTKREVGICKLILGPGPFRYTRAETIDIFKRHEEAIRATNEMFYASKWRLTQASVMAPFARAWYTYDKRELSRFVRALLEGSYQSTDEAPAIALRDFLKEKVQKTCGGSAKKEIYFKTERALFAFLNGERIGRLHAATHEMFPLPADK